MMAMSARRSEVAGDLWTRRCPLVWGSPASSWHGRGTKRCLARARTAGCTWEGQGAPRARWLAASRRPVLGLPRNPAMDARGGERRPEGGARAHRRADGEVDGVGEAPEEA